MGSELDTAKELIAVLEARLARLERFEEGARPLLEATLRTLDRVDPSGASAALIRIVLCGG